MLGTTLSPPVASGHPQAPGPESGRPGLRPDIQGLRAVAVLLVICNHARVPGFGGGYAGVDVFFVVSGYVITRGFVRTAGGGARRTLTGFYSRRVRRIVPAASGTLVGTLAASRLLLGQQFDPALLGDARWAALFGANAHFIATGSDYFVPGAAPSLVTQFWSLAVEEQFYLVFPLLAVAAAALTRADPRLRNPALFLGLAPLVALSAWWSSHSSAAEPAVAYYSPFTRFWELGVGCLLALAASRAHRRNLLRDRCCAAIGASGLVLTMVLLPGRSGYPGTLAWLPVASTALLLVAGRSGPRLRTVRLLSTGPLTWVGDRSYSLYLWHWVWLQLPGQLARPLDGPGWRLLELAGTAVTAALSYRWLESPVRRSRRLATDPIATGLVLAVCIAGVVTATLILTRFTG